MFRSIALAVLLLPALSATPVLAQQSAVATAPTAATAATKSGHMAIDGVNYYYELHGKGEPLLLLHGGLGSIDMFRPMLPTLAANRLVIAVDLHGHGRTALGERPFRLDAIGNDMATLVRKLGHEQVDVLGYSLGGGVALRMALQQPASVRRMALVSAGFSNEGFHPDVRVQQVALTGKAAPMMLDTPMYRSYAAVAPKVEDFPRLLDVLGDLMRESFDLSAEIPRLKMPVMLVYGDGDMYRPQHVIEFYQLLGGGLRDAGWNRETLSQNRLAILPDLTHYDIFTSPRMYDTALQFLDGRKDVASWAEQVEAN